MRSGSILTKLPQSPYGKSGKPEMPQSDPSAKHSPHVDYLSADSESVAGARLSIDLAALEHNYDLMRKQSGRAQCAAVVKSDAYGTGLEQAAPIFWHAGCRTFFVALPQEGARLRTILQEATIYVLNGFVGDSSDTNARYYQDHALRPVLGSHEEVELWHAYCTKIGTPLPCALHFDTGMNRLGLTLKAAHKLSARWANTPPAFEPALIMSHLACADDPKHPMNSAQLTRFREIRSCFPDIPASLANSAGIFLGPDYHFDLTRPGIALYGGQPINDHPNPMQVVATLEARLLSTRTVPAGWSVSYGAGERTQRDSRLATISIGYADGYLRAAGSSDARKGAKVWLSGYEAPLMGRVTMDLSIIDVTDVPETHVKRGVWVEMFGPHIAIDNVATLAGTISYELLTSLGLRAHRRYL